VRLNTDEVLISGEYAFARGADMMIQDQDGRQVGETGKWLFIYRRQPDGAWKYHWVTFIAMSSDLLSTDCGSYP
jgi:ketosteroid isomerase-like protein